MEYCITILVQAFNPSEKFTSPQSISTALGEAIRASDVGKYFWTDDIFVEIQPEMPYLLTGLPNFFRQQHWLFLGVGGKGVKRFEDRVNQKSASSVIDLTKEPLLLLFSNLLGGQESWAVFFLRDCDQVDAIFDQSLPELCLTIIQACDADNETVRGFCSFFYKHIY